jgi:conjugal transfer pilus assembly protein TraB
VLEKFKAEKKRNMMIIIGTICIISAIVLFAGELFSPKEKKVVPDITVVDAGKIEEQSFRKVYGDRLSVLERQVNNIMDTINRIYELEKSTKPEFKEQPEEEQQQQPFTSPTPPQNDNLSKVEERANDMNAEMMQKQQEMQQRQQFLSSLRPEDIQPRTVDNLIVFNEQTPEEKAPAEDKNKSEYIAKVAENTIPSGTFVQAILLSGVDAPTGQQAKSEPHPVLLDLKDKAFLPNKWRDDIRECFVLGSAYGDISAERAYIRAEKFSCVRTDGTILERKVEGYVAGEDGKVGLAGTVVSKQGAMLARTLVAGFLEGVATAFNESNTNYDIGDEGVIKSFDTSEAGGMAAFGGMSRAAERLSEFYMNMVNQMFPVVEINAGRKVDVVFLQQVNLDEEQNDYKEKFDVNKINPMAVNKRG